MSVSLWTFAIHDVLLTCFLNKKGEKHY